MAQINIKNTTFVIADGSTNTLALRVGDGDFTYKVSQSFDYIKDRGILDTVRKGNEVPCQVDFDIIWDFLKSSSADSVPTPEEVLKQTGLASSWVTSDSDDCKPYSVDLIVTNTENCGADSTETLTFTTFRFEDLKMDLKASRIKVSGKCNIVRPTAVRS